MVKNLFNNSKAIKIIAHAFILFFQFSINAQPAGKPLGAEAAKGEELFKTNCSSCHAMDVKLVGPALHEVATKRKKEWLHQWIKNNEKLRASGDKDAIAIYNEYGKAAMNTFEQLGDDNINLIIAYLSEWTPAPKAKKETGGGAAEAQTSFYSTSTLYFLLAIIVVLCIVLLLLRRTKNTLKATAAELEEASEETSKPSAFAQKMAKLKKLSNPTIVKLTIGALLMFSLAAYGFVFGVTEVSNQQYYAPEQPIKFSHKIHAGEYQIDCKYCHSTVEKSKNASIPSVNTCFNCHKGVQARDKYDGEISPEIKKIYAAMDYNPDGKPGEQFGTNPKPVKWIRIHNLPDYANFNHSHHVSTAGLTCQTCHGPIQEMAVVQQFSTLQMGWCIDCHRERNIDVENNPYYEKLHAKIKAEKNNKNSVYSKYYTADGKINIKASEFGALECSKCHY